MQNLQRQTEPARFVFLYYTESNSGVPANHVYRYELIDNKLINSKLILDLPASPGPFHNGGKVLIGPDTDVYAIISDLLYHRTQAQNTAPGPPDLTRITGLCNRTSITDVPNAIFSVSSHKSKCFQCIEYILPIGGELPIGGSRICNSSKRSFMLLWEYGS